MFLAYGEDAIDPLRAQTTHTAPRMPLDKELFPLRECGVGGTCTNSNSSATIHSRGRDSCSGLVFARDTVFGRWFSLVSINLGIWLYGVETGDTGESIEPEESH